MKALLNITLKKNEEKKEPKNLTVEERLVILVNAHKEVINLSNASRTLITLKFESHHN